MTPARQAAAAAFAELDAIDRRCLNPIRRVADDLPAKEHALRRLAVAMHQIYGPLPAHTHGGQVCAEVDDWADRQDDIGDELADRDDRDV